MRRDYMPPAPVCQENNPMRAAAGARIGLSIAGKNEAGDFHGLEIPRLIGYRSLAQRTLFCSRRFLTISSACE